GTAKLLWAHRVSYLLSTWSCPLWLESWVGNGAGGRQRRLPSTSTPALRPRTLRQAAASWHLEDNPASALRAPSRQPGTGNWHGLAGLVIVHPELKARVGDSVPLKCSFLSSEPQGWAVWRVDWIYRPQNATQPGGAAGRFQSRVRWLGNVSCGDGAVELRDVRGNDSGTYTCEIRLWSHSAVYKNRTLLRVDPAEGRRASGSDSPSAESPSKASSWGVVGYIGTAIFLGISLGLILRKTVWRLRPWESVTRRRSPDKRKENVYCPVPSLPAPKPWEEEEPRGRTEATYITMRPSVAGLALQESNVYVCLERKKIPAEWTRGWEEGHENEGTQGRLDSCSGLCGGKPVQSQAGNLPPQEQPFPAASEPLYERQISPSAEHCPPW
uniref:Ig-like domain-containing protein n=1 Tax=Sphenodon punctatus TaxID=8508 RepID=A0A8D0GKF2_SPHPU